MKFSNASQKRRIIPLDPLPGKVHYFRGSDPGGWHTNIPTYAKVKVPQIYPGIDLIFYGNQRRLEYDLVVAPGADLNEIQIVLEGLEKIRIDSDGHLVGRRGSGELRLEKPKIYQDDPAGRREIRGGYVLHEAKEYEGVRTSSVSPARGTRAGRAGRPHTSRNRAGPIEEYSLAFGPRNLTRLDR